MLRFSRNFNTGSYEIEFSMPMTVREFIDELLTNYPNEWGYIGIKHEGSIFGKPYCEYNWGKLLSSLPEEYLDKEILNITGSGDWSRSDFIIETVESKDEETIKHLKDLKSFHNGSYGPDIDEAIKALEEKNKKLTPDSEAIEPAKLTQMYGNLIAVKNLEVTRALLEDYKAKFCEEDSDINIAFLIIDKQIEAIKKGGILEDADYS